MYFCGGPYFRQKTSKKKPSGILFIAADREQTNCSLSIYFIQTMSILLLLQAHLLQYEFGGNAAYQYLQEQAYR